MRVSLNVTNYTWSDEPASIPRHLGEVVRAADQGGLDTVWLSDHLLQADPSSTIEAEMLEAYTTLGYLAARTERIRLGTMVTATTYRPPALLVKAVTTLDVLSGGRAWLGIGAGYHEPEARALDLPLPPTAERLERLEETLRLALQMWSGDERPFQGRHHHLERPLNNPNSVRRPHPPILVGGMGERVTLRLVAQYADGCNLPDIPDGGRTIRHKLQVLAEHCQRAGRPPEAVEKTVSTRLEPGESPEAFAKRCQTLAGLGIQHVVVIVAGPWTPEAVGVLAAAVPQVAGS